MINEEAVLCAAFPEYGAFAMHAPRVLPAPQLVIAARRFSGRTEDKPLNISAALLTRCAPLKTCRHSNG